MKKIIFALITIFTLVACSDEENKLPYPAPSKAIEMQVEDIVGTYRLIEIRDDHTNSYFKRPNLYATFNTDFTGEEVVQEWAERHSITWKYENKRLIYDSFYNGKVEAWFIKQKDNYYFYYKARYPQSASPETLYTHEYVKITEANN